MNLISEFAGLVLSLPEEKVTAQMATRINQALQQGYQALDQVNKFSITTSGNDNIRATHQQRIHLVQEAATKVETEVLSLTAYLTVNKFSSEIAGARAGYEEAANSRIKLLDDAVEKANSAADAAKAAAANTAVGVYSANFEAEAAEFRAASNRWLITAAGLGAVSVGAALALTTFWPATGLDASLVQYGVTKLFILGGLATATVMHLLLSRDAIPNARWEWWVNPRYQHGRIKASRRGIFERNGTKGDAIYAHGNFLRHLRYFLDGADLPAQLIDRFAEKVEDCGQLSGSDALDLGQFARQEVRRYGLKAHDVYEEFYKLALDCGRLRRARTYDLRTGAQAALKKLHVRRAKPHPYGVALNVFPIVRHGLRPAKQFRPIPAVAEPH